MKRRLRHGLAAVSIVVGAMLAAAAGVVPAVAATAPASALACSVSGQPHFSTGSIAGRRVGRLTVHFPTTCGYQVRAFYEHPSAFGPQTEHGPTVHGSRVSSSLTSQDPSYCRLGWERHVGRAWRQTTLRRHGSC